MAKTKEKMLKELEIKLAKAEHSFHDTRLFCEKLEYLQKTLHEQKTELIFLKDKLAREKESIPDFEEKVYESYEELFRAKEKSRRTTKYIQDTAEQISKAEQIIEFKNRQKAELNKQIEELRNQKKQKKKDNNNTKED